MNDDVIVTEGLRKRYGDTNALDGLDLRVPPGTVHGVLGPNGAGKTTLVRVLATLLRFDAGTACVCGYDVALRPQRVRSRIALTGQYAAVDELLTGRENLLLFARLHRLSGRAAKRRADELLERFDLTAAAGRPVRQYSGGMRRRLDLAVSMIRTPRVLFLDEPTTGLDPRSRNQLWEAIRQLVVAGTTVLLTTQYLEEADQLADRISVVDHGRVVADGTPDELKSRAGGDRLEVVLRDGDGLAPAAHVLRRVGADTPDVDLALRRVSVPVTDRVAALTEAVRELSAVGVAVVDIGVRRPTLDEAFLRLTGAPRERVA